MMMKLFIISLFLAPLLQAASTLTENFELYQAPQALAMGDALTADAEGHLANYYNPAGLAKLRKKERQVNVIDIEAFGSANFYTSLISSPTFGSAQFLSALQSNPSQYRYMRVNALSSFAVRGFSLCVLGTMENAGVSDGTNVDAYFRTDVGATVGVGRNFAGNLVKLGAVAKALVRNELDGNFLHSDLSANLNGNMQEGLAIGGDIGLLITLPFVGLPTLGIAWKDIFDTKFNAFSLLNGAASGAPAQIDQSINAAISMHPYITHKLKITIAFQIKHLEQTTTDLRRRASIGIQIADSRRSYFWAGLSNFQPSAGVALRLPGGHFEIGTYAVSTGTNAGFSVNDRRYFFRYTISF